MAGLKNPCPSGIFPPVIIRWQWSKEMAVEVSMVFKISKVQGQPELDSLPVAKIIDYPLEKRDYKPFAQAIICLSEEGLLVRLWAFEATPEAESAVRTVLQLAPEREGAPLLSVEALSGGKVTFLVDGAEWDAARLHLHPFTGEDLQGIYWGMDILFPQGLLAELYPGLTLLAGSRVLGNFYKLSTGARPHRGSFFPVDMTRDPFLREQLGEFLVVSF